MKFVQNVLKFLGVTRWRQNRDARKYERYLECKESSESEKHSKSEHAFAFYTWSKDLLHFRPKGYLPNDWLAPLSETADARYSLCHLNMHPLAAYRALGLSHVVDHWVALVAGQGWEKVMYRSSIHEFGFYKEWGHIEHPSFWKEVASMLAINDTTGSEGETLLSHAGWAGNIVPFEAMPTDAVEKYSRTATTCHPRVALWLEAKGLWSKDRLVPSMGTWSEMFPLHGNTFLQWTATSPIPIAYVQDWLTAVLEHYPLSQEEKIRFVGQAFIAFGGDAWDKHFDNACKPYTRDIDMPCLRAICGIFPQNPNRMQMSFENAMVVLTQDVRNKFQEKNIDPLAVLSSAFVHDKVLLLLSLLNQQRPANRAELYNLAVAARSTAVCDAQALDTIALPSLT